MCDGRVVCGVERPLTRAARRRGLLGRDGIDGALVLERTSSVHTFGMRFPLEVALLGPDHTVVAVRSMAPGHLLLPRWGVRAVVEAEADAFPAWGLSVGSRLSWTL